jgi:gliding motility-associated-like protein
MIFQATYCAEIRLLIRIENLVTLKSATRQMKHITTYLSILLLLTFFSQQSYATHARAGEIIYRQIGDPSEYKYEITVVYYTEISSPANRDEIDIYFGDNTMETVRYKEKIDLGNYTLYNTYQTTHTYPGPGRYIITFFDPNRIADIVNMANSVLTPFYVETELIINSFIGRNRSPILLQPPIDYAEINQVYKHNPGAFDPDGDSLVYSLIAPKMDVGKNVVGYYQPPAPNAFTLDPYTGDLIWDYPTKQGIYNIAIYIEEYRNGQYIGSITRDMQIIVEVGINNPPYFEDIRDTCVEAGKAVRLKIPIVAHDKDVSQKLTITANGGPFTLNNSPAEMKPAVITGFKDVYATFEWTPDCQHIRKEPYSVVFKVTDNHSVVPLSDLQQIFIKVLGPAPENLSLTNSIKGIQLDWDKPSACGNVRGYYIYRKIDTSYWDTSRCENGVPAYSGFRRIAKIIGEDSTQFFDDDNGKGLTPGITYCYRVTAIYLSEGNFEVVEGYASREVCGTQKKELPVITHVSIQKTDQSNGIVYMDWSKPNEIDTLVFTGPYENRIYRSKNGGAFELIRVDYSPYFSELNDTVLVDSNQNTVDNQFRYRIEFYGADNSSPFLLGTSQVASSIYLQAKASHRKNSLNWNVDVPWFNQYYVVYLYDETSAQYDSIAYTNAQSYTHEGLENGEEYCYLIKSYGYFLAGTSFVFPIINYSQEICSTPLDTIPPCPPEVKATAFCPEHRNEVIWDYTDPSCAQDVVSYNIYYSRLQENNYKLIAQVPDFTSDYYNDNRLELTYSLAGCYVVTAIDSFGNESAFSNESCVDNCPYYILPNIFTPNGDGINDLVQPLDGSMHIDRVNMKIFNRWGQVVFQTHDPMINWDGKDFESNIDCSEGVYYYICDVYQIYLEGPKEVNLKGTIYLIR